jgi:hypothetical protein
MLTFGFNYVEDRGLGTYVTRAIGRQRPSRMTSVTARPHVATLRRATSCCVTHAGNNGTRRQNWALMFHAASVAPDRRALKLAPNGRTSVHGFPLSRRHVFY